MQHHIAELEQLGYLMVIVICGVIYRKIVVGGIEMEMLIIVVGEVHRVAASVADNEELHEAHQRVGVAIATILLVVNDLFHRLHRRNTVTLQLNLDQRQSVDENDDIVSLVAICGVNSELVHHLVIVLAPVAKVHEAVIEGRTVVAREGLLLTETL